jgi:desulfoferrodoxin (superoxide reductase-like protein)
MFSPPGGGGGTSGARMGDESSVGERQATREKKVVPVLSREAEARLIRGMAVLVGLVPLPQMTQHETDWVFRQKVRMAGED